MIVLPRLVVCHSLPLDWLCVLFITSHLKLGFIRTSGVFNRFILMSSGPSLLDGLPGLDSLLEQANQAHQRVVTGTFTPLQASQQIFFLIDQYCLANPRFASPTGLSDQLWNYVFSHLLGRMQSYVPPSQPPPNPYIPWGHPWSPCTHWMHPPPAEPQAQGTGTAVAAGDITGLKNAANEAAKEPVSKKRGAAEPQPQDKGTAVAAVDTAGLKNAADEAIHEPASKKRAPSGPQPQGKETTVAAVDAAGLKNAAEPQPQGRGAAVAAVTAAGNNKMFFNVFVKNQNGNQDAPNAKNPICHITLPSKESTFADARKAIEEALEFMQVCTWKFVFHSLAPMTQRQESDAVLSTFFSPEELGNDTRQNPLRLYVAIYYTDI